jgi:hypothetical protein
MNNCLGQVALLFELGDEVVDADFNITETGGLQEALTLGEDVFNLGGQIFVFALFILCTHTHI